MAPTCASVTCDGLPDTGFGLTRLHAPRPTERCCVSPTCDSVTCDGMTKTGFGLMRLGAPYNVSDSGTLCSLRMFRDIPEQLALETAPTPTLLLLALAALTHSEAHLAPAAPTGPWPLR